MLTAFLSQHASSFNVVAVNEDTSSENQMFGECNRNSNKGQQNLHQKMN